MIRILVTGSRYWSDYAKVAHALSATVMELIQKNPDEKKIVIVHGDCPARAEWKDGKFIKYVGADHYASEWTNKVQRSMKVRGYDIKQEKHPANWQKNNRGAGMIRNQEMVDLGADVCLAFILDNSSGATHCAERADEAGIDTRRYTASSVNGGV